MRSLERPDQDLEDVYGFELLLTLFAGGFLEDTLGFQFGDRVSRGLLGDVEEVRHLGRRDVGVSTTVPRSFDGADRNPAQREKRDQMTA